jgi:serine O-acetyltransferase
MLNKIFLFLNMIRGIPAWVAMGLSGAKETVRKETSGYTWFLEGETPGFFLCFQLLLWKNPCYRNQVIYRCSQGSRLWGLVIRFVYPPKQDLEVGGDIGEGLVIFHGHGTVIAPYRIGRNFSIYQGVTVGNNRKAGQDRHNPIIGDNVTVYTNAVVAGGITIGDNVVIAAGAVVMKDVPSNSIAMGNPCVIKPRKMV